MKKSLVALAVAAALPAVAFAQTNIVLNGSLDMSLESVNDDANGGNGSDLKLTNGIWAGSRFAIVGTEELGGGLKAIFNIEHRLAPDTGTVTSGATFWAGQAWVGLQGGFGAVRMGRQYTPIFRALIVADTTGYSWYNNQVGLAGTRVRFGNEIEYKSPSLGGFTLYGAFAPGGGNADNIQESADAKAGDTVGLAGVGKFGPVSFGVGYHNIKENAAGDKRTELGLGLGGKLGPIGLGLTYANRNPSGDNNNTKAFGFTASGAFGAGTVYLSLTQTNPDGDNNNNMGLGLTYSHGLTKRTFMYASLGYNKQQTAGDDVKPRAIALGVRHFF